MEKLSVSAFHWAALIEARQLGNGIKLDKLLKRDVAGRGLAAATQCNVTTIDCPFCCPHADIINIGVATLAAAGAVEGGALPISGRALMDVAAVAAFN